MGIKLSSCRPPDDRRPQPPRTHQPSHRLSRRRLRSADDWASSFPQRPAAASPAFALTPSSGTIPAELGGHALPQWSPAAWSARSLVHIPRWRRHDHGPALWNPARPPLQFAFSCRTEGWVAEEAATRLLYRGRVRQPQKPGGRGATPSTCGSRTSPTPMVVRPGRQAGWRCGKASSPHAARSRHPENQRPRP